MASQLTIEETIDVGHVSAALASLYVSKKMMYGGSVIKPIPPLQIQIISDVLEWANDGGAETDQVLRNLANYLYWLSESFQLEAQNIISGPGGGSVAPTPAGTGGVEALDFEVTASSIIPTGGTSLLINGSNGLPDYRGYRIVNISRGGVWQNTTSLNDGSNYYAWNSVTGLLSIFAAAGLGELIRITPDATGGTSSGTSANTPDTIILSANGTYTLASGYQIWKITINPSVADTVRIGTTANGEEIMMDKVMTINTYANNGVTADVFAEGGDETIYFTGFTGAATINIYTLPI
jgi:hypothetical protein